MPVVCDSIPEKPPKQPAKTNFKVLINFLIKYLHENYQSVLSVSPNVGKSTLFNALFSKNKVELMRRESELSVFARLSQMSGIVEVPEYMNDFRFWPKIHNRKNRKNVPAVVDFL
jgi:hypothetical protein